MSESKWEKYKKQDTLEYLSIDEKIVLLVGFLIFGFFQSYGIIFIIFVILWYWLKIRYYERKIIEKEKQIYNVNYERMKKEDGLPVNQTAHEKLVEIERVPLRHDLNQVENKRKFLVDKFVVLNLILIVLIELFIKK